MKHLTQNALDAAVRRGTSYANVRVIESREHHAPQGNAGLLASSF